MRAPAQVVIQLGTPLNEEQIKGVFGVGKETAWYKAIIQILDTYRVERQSMASSFLSENNSLGMAGCNGAIDIINAILADLDNRRIQANR